jgi:hypothetical protein
MVKKYTKKLKQSGAGFRIRSRLRNMFRRKKNEVKPNKISDNNTSTTLDKLFYKLCHEKLERYKTNPKEEAKGPLYTACFWIGKKKFTDIDNKRNNNAFDKYVAEQKSITRNRPFVLEDLSTNDRQLFIDIDAISKKLNEIEDSFYTNITIPSSILHSNTATPTEKDRVKKTIRQTIRDCESEIKSIRAKIHDLFLKTKILIDQKTLSYFNVKYNHLIQRFKDVFLLIKNYNQRTKLELGEFTLKNNNIILNTSEKRFLKPSNEKIDKEKSIVEKLSDSLRMQNFIVRSIENEYNMTKNKNHTDLDLVARFIDQLRNMQKELRYIYSKYKQLSNEQHTYNLSNLKSLKELYTSVYNKFKVLFNNIVTENKLELPKIGLNNNTKTVPVSPL